MNRLAAPRVGETARRAFSHRSLKGLTKRNQSTSAPNNTDNQARMAFPFGSYGGDLGTTSPEQLNEPNRGGMLPAICGPIRSGEIIAPAVRNPPPADAEATVDSLPSTTMPEGLCSCVADAPWPRVWHTEAACSMFEGAPPLFGRIVRSQRRRPALNPIG